MTLEALAPRQQQELEQVPLLRACCIPLFTCKWSCFYFKPFSSWGELPLIGTADPEWEKESFLKDFCWQETLRLIYSSVAIPLIWLMIHGLPTDAVCLLIPVDACWLKQKHFEKSACGEEPFNLFYFWACLFLTSFQLLPLDLFLFLNFIYTENIWIGMKH